MGKRTYPCTPWGMPTYNIFGWQKPCYLLQDGYAETFKELLDDHRLEQLRHRIRQSEVRELHGPQRLRSLSAVNATFSSLGGFLATVKATLVHQLPQTKPR